MQADVFCTTEALKIPPSEVSEFEELKSKVRKGDFVICGYAATYEKCIDGKRLTRESLGNAVNDLKARPTLLFNHNVDRPIGRFVTAKLDDVGLWVAYVIDPSEKEIIEKIKNGTLSKFSIRGLVVYDKEHPNVAKQCRLLEVSLVSVPVDAKSTIKAWFVKRGFDLNSLIEGGNPMSEEILKKQQEELERGKEELQKEREELNKLKEDLERAKKEIEDAKKEVEAARSELEEDRKLLESERADFEAEKADFEAEQIDEIGERGEKSDTDDLILDLIDRIEEADLNTLKKEVHEILVIVREIKAAIGEKYPYPYPKPEEVKKSLEAHEKSLEETKEAVKGLIEPIAEKVEELSNVLIVRGKDTNDDDKNKESPIEALKRSEEYKKLDPASKLRVLLETAKGGK